MNELIILAISGMWVVLIGYLASGFVSCKIAEARFKLAKAEYYRKKAIARSKQKVDLSSIGSIDDLLEQLGIDASILQNPIVKKLIEKYLGSASESSESVQFLG